MNVIISFAGLEVGQNILKSRRPFPLQPLAGSTILGHILERLKDVPVQSYVVIVNAGAGQVVDWANQILPESIMMHVLTVQDAATLTAALSHCKPFLTSEPLLLIAGDFVTEAEYAGLDSYGTDVVCLIQDGDDLIPAENLPFGDAGFSASQSNGTETYWAGGCWFRYGKDLWSAIAGSTMVNEREVGALLSYMNDQGLTIATMPADTCLGTGSPERLLHANARLMQLGYCSEDAIERSYSEEFTVLPPVFLHETAVIENSVIGPFVNLEAGSVVSNCVVRNTLVGAGAQIKDAVLDGSLIGDQAQVNGRKQTVIAGDQSQVILD